MLLIQVIRIPVIGCQSTQWLVHGIAEWSIMFEHEAGNEADWVLGCKVASRWAGRSEVAIEFCFSKKRDESPRVELRSARRYMVFDNPWCDTWCLKTSDVEFEPNGKESAKTNISMNKGSVPLTGQAMNKMNNLMLGALQPPFWQEKQQCYYNFLWTKLWSHCLGLVILAWYTWHSQSPPEVLWQLL